ncbi:MAG: DnaD domain protein [Clostridiales Family XIII bacterium]|nr:DnaD domain protein [Clostridiales Family XIII bacterium]
MSFRIEDSSNYFLDDTLVPNLFIAEYMPDTPGEFVKVYLYSYMCVQQGKALTNEIVAEKLSLDREVVFSAWQYFEDRKMIKKHHAAPQDGYHFDVEFMDIKSRLFGGAAAADSSSESASDLKKTSLGNEELQKMWAEIAEITGDVTLSGGDIKKIGALIAEDGATPEVIICAYKYARDRKKSMKTAAVSKRIASWTEKGLKTAADVSAFLAETDVRYSAYREIMKALGLGYSSLADAEKKEFDKWFDEYGYSLSEILEICAKAAGKNNKFNYVRGIIRKEVALAGKDGLKGPSAMADRDEHYRKLREKTEAEAAARTREVYAAIPELSKIEDEIGDQNFERIKILTSNLTDKEAATASIEKAVAKLEARKEALLKDGGFALDYMEHRPNCEHCGDTGILDDGTACSCYIGEK